MTVGVNIAKLARDLGAIRVTTDNKTLYIQPSEIPSNIWGIRLAPSS